MRRSGLRGLAVITRKMHTTDSRHDHPIAPNRLRRSISVTAPNQIWLADLTYLRTGEGWFFLAAITWREYPPSLRDRMIGFANHSVHL